MKDVGGLVTDYQRQTEIYRREGREVRLHECRSACTMALSLPNVCVYPTSVLRFHQAYNRDTKQVDHGVSDQLFSTYPEPIRRRLGYLTRQYRSLSGAELIDLGVRSCNETPVMFAQRMQKKNGGTMVASATPPAAGSGEPSTLSRLAGTLSAMLTGAAQPTSTAIPSRPSGPTLVARGEPASVPLPPVRPADLGEASAATQEEETSGVPLPPERPAHLAPAIQVASKPNNKPFGELPRMITGSWPVLPPLFSAYAPLR
jgi:hypothetical protein